MAFGDLDAFDDTFLFSFFESFVGLDTAMKAPFGMLRDIDLIVISEKIDLINIGSDVRWQDEM